MANLLYLNSAYYYIFMNLFDSFYNLNSKFAYIYFRELDQSEPGR